MLCMLGQYIYIGRDGGDVSEKTVVLVHVL